jgi:hypothetical protein
MAEMEHRDDVRAEDEVDLVRRDLQDDSCDIWKAALLTSTSSRRR